MGGAAFSIESKPGALIYLIINKSDDYAVILTKIGISKK